jgi:hypothetical protein
VNRDAELHELLDREQIRELAHRYSIACDSRDYDDLAELFDPEMDSEKYGAGQAGVKAYYERILGAMTDGSVLHQIGNHQIDFVDDAHATGVCYVRCLAGGADRWIDIAAIYVDEYVRRDGRWYFEHRHPAELQRTTIETPAAHGWLSLAEGWDIYRQHREARRTA